MDDDYSNREKPVPWSIFLCSTMTMNESDNGKKQEKERT